MTDHRPRDPVADDIAARNPDSDDVVAGEQVLDAGHVAPEPDDFADSDDSGDNDTETSAEKRHAADERTDAGAPPAQPEGTG